MASGRTSRPGHSLAVLVLAALTIIVVTSRLGGPVRSLRGLAADVTSPVRRAGGAIASPFGNMYDTMTKSGDLKAENKRLRRELDEALADRLRYADALRVTDELLRLAKFDNPDKIPSLDASVVGRSPSNFEDTVEIDRGSSAGVAVGNPVVSGSGLVGRVRSVSRTKAVVELITEPGASVGVRLSTSGEVGFARADRSGKLSVELIVTDTKVDVGEILMTTGFDGSAYPHGIVVGKVAKAEVKPGDLQMRLEIRPIVDPKRLSFVKILRWQEGQDFSDPATRPVPAEPTPTVAATNAPATNAPATGPAATGPATTGTREAE